MTADVTCGPIYEADIEIKVSENGVQARGYKFPITVPFTGGGSTGLYEGNTAAGIKYNFELTQKGANTTFAIRHFINDSVNNSPITIPTGSTVDVACSKLALLVSSSFLVSGQPNQPVELMITNNATNTAFLVLGDPIQCKYTINIVPRTLTISGG